MSKRRHTSWAWGKAARGQGALPKLWPLATIHPSPRMANGPTSGVWGVVSRPFCPVREAGSTERAPVEGLFSVPWTVPDGGSWTSPGGEGPPGGGGCKEPRALPRQPPLPAPSRARPLPRGPTSQPGNSESTALRPDARLQPHGGLLCAGRSGNVGQRLLTWPWARATGRRITGTARGRRGPRPQQLSRLHTDPHPQTGAACRGAPTTQHLHLCWGPAPGAPSSKQLCCWEMPPVWCLLQPLQTTGHRAGGRH